MKLRTLKTTLRTLTGTTRQAPAQPDRLRGRAGQSRRLRLWTVNPCCAMCGKLTEYPDGFHLDHVVARTNGGPDVDENLQVLCCGPGSCHDKKTALDLGYRPRVRVSLDGWPEEPEGGR